MTFDLSISWYVTRNWEWAVILLNRSVEWVLDVSHYTSTPDQQVVTTTKIARRCPVKTYLLLLISHQLRSAPIGTSLWSSHAPLPLQIVKIFSITVYARPLGFQLLPIGNELFVGNSVKVPTTASSHYVALQSSALSIHRLQSNPSKVWHWPSICCFFERSVISVYENAWNRHFVLYANICKYPVSCVIYSVPD